MELLHANSINRVIAGYTKEWKSKPSRNKGKKYNQLPYDWEEGENKWRWNQTNKNWVNLKNSKNEIGCIHSIQGIDLDFVGVIIGNDLTVNEEGELIAIKENYKDLGGIPLKEEFDSKEFTEYILHVYYILLTRGIKGCRVYFEDEKVKNHFKNKLS